MPPSLPDGIPGAAVRFALLVGAVVAAVAAVALPLALATGGSIGRAFSAGLYLAGSSVMLLGFVAGNRGPLRRTGERFLDRGVRRATAEERRSTIAFSAVLVVAGLLVIVLGVAVDARVRLI